MPFNDLRDWLDHLRTAGELHEVDAEVDPYLEITEITDRMPSPAARRSTSATSRAPSCRS